ncbi:MAG: hypothetical protein HC838_05030 [Spirulinaceae cyanobacterium RM2_2_10]|nr:hypothetical protein [Spirulinaceae cyanobacterium SM2_1_0]NJO19540.1 hypothetical protein [Spirulinaceae cyanobacterium RM2_2_10]
MSEPLTAPRLLALRASVASYAPAQTALSTIEDCEGDLEDAAIALAIRAGQQPEQDNERWLAGLAKRCRAKICHPDLRTQIEGERWGEAAQLLAATKLIPDILALPVLLYAQQQNLEQFCAPLDGVL